MLLFQESLEGLVPSGFSRNAVHVVAVMHQVESYIEMEQRLDLFQKEASVLVAVRTQLHLIVNVAEKLHVKLDKARVSGQILFDVP